MLSLVEIGSVILEKKIFNFVNVCLTDRQTDRRRTTGDQKSPLELSAQVIKKLKGEDRDMH